MAGRSRSLLLMILTGPAHPFVLQSELVSSFRGRPMSGLEFTDAAAKRLEKLYLTKDVLSSFAG